MIYDVKKRLNFFIICNFFRDLGLRQGTAGLNQTV